MKRDSKTTRKEIRRRTPAESALAPVNHFT